MTIFGRVQGVEKHRPDPEAVLSPTRYAVCWAIWSSCVTRASKALSEI